MSKPMDAILSDAGISPAEYAVMWHIQDTVVQPRDVIAAWAAEYPPNVLSSEISVGDCLHGIDAAIRKGLLVELTAAEIDADLARWRAERLPVSWGVDRDRGPGDVDLTEAGFRLMETIARQEAPDRQRAPRVGYNDEASGMIRVFGETEESCRSAVESVVVRLHDTPWRWPREVVQSEAMRPLGPWWYSRFEQVPTGFEIVLRRADRR